MNIQEWREKQKKTVECPSGASAVYRKMTAGDVLCIMGGVPGLNIKRAEDSTTHKEGPTDSEKADAIRLHMTRGIVSYCGAKVVDKPESEVADGEISYHEIPIEDVNHLMGLIAGASNPEVDKDGPNSAARFPESTV